MPENQTQPNTGGSRDGPAQVLQPQPDPPPQERLSDTEAAHSPGEGESPRDPRREETSFASGEDKREPDTTRFSGRDRREDYGSASANLGTDRHTAGAAFADRLPEAARTLTDGEGRPAERGVE